MLAISKVCKHLGESFEQTKENIEGKVVVEEKVATTTEPIVVEQRNTYISSQQSTKSGFTVKWRMREAAVALLFINLVIGLTAIRVLIFLL